MYFKDRWRPDYRKEIGALGLKWNNEDFTESIRSGNLLVITEYLKGGMPSSGVYNNAVFDLTLGVGKLNFGENSCMLSKPLAAKS